MKSARQPFIFLASDKMKRYPLLLIAGLSLSAISMSAQIQQKALQIQLGHLLPTDSVCVYVEYPEFEPLTKVEVKKLKAQGFEPEHDVKLNVTKSLSRGETVLDVNFVPVVKRRNKWLRVKNCEVKSRIIGPRLSSAQQTLLRTTQQVKRAARYAPHSVLAQGKWVKIRVKKEGMHQLSHAQLKKMGFTDPAKVKLYGYGGRLLPDVFTFQNADALIDDLNEVPLYRRGESVLFFAEGLLKWSEDGKFQKNTFSNYSYYFLTEGENPASFTTLEKTAGSAAKVNQVKALALNDNDAFVWYGGGRDFYDSKDTENPTTYTLKLPGNVGETSTVNYDVSAQSSNGAVTVKVMQAGGSGESQALISRFGEGESARGYRNSFQAEMGTEETFIVKSSASGRLNYLSCVYDQRLSSKYTTQVFSAHTKDAVTFEVADADANTRVWQIGDAETVLSELPGELNGTTYNAYAADGSKRFVLVDVTKTYDSPEVVGAVANQDLHADTACDYVIIVPASGKLTAQAERLAEAHRQKQNLRVRVVNAGQLYNEFSSGTPDAAAYRRYLKMLYDRAETPNDAPKYLLLFGDCVYDNRMITSEFKGGNPDDYLLAYERNDHENYVRQVYSIGTLHSFVTDDYFALLDDNEGKNQSLEKIDLGVGRFPCNTEEKAKWLVDQSISYMENKKTGSWKNKMWAIGDSGDDNLHMDDAEKVSKQVASSMNGSFLLRKIYPDAYSVTLEAKGATYPEATQKLKTAMQQGALIFNYNGHGRPDRLSHKFLLDKKDMTDNISQSAPLWIFSSCEITPYDQPIEDLGRNALYAPQAPAVAVLCAARSVYANYNLSLNRGYIKYLFGKDKTGKRNTLGDALRLTKTELLSSSSGIGTDQTINKLKYVLLGDPALTLSYTEEGIMVDSVNGESAATFQHLPVGKVVRFSGYVNADKTAKTPDESFNGTLTGMVFMPKQSITCKGYGNNYEDPLTYSDYTQVLYEGSVEVKKGRFNLELMIPRGISFSTQKALLSLYAVNADATVELNGHYDQFCMNGTATPEVPDTLGPQIYMYFNTPDFPDGGTITPGAICYASVADSSAISMLSGNMGHDMEVWFDNDPSTRKVVSDFFTFDYGSYSKGMVEFPLPSLPLGRHSISFRAWDVFDNSTTSTLNFVLSEGTLPEFDVISTEYTPRQSTNFITTFVASAEVESEVVTEVYNIAGIRVWHSSARVPVGNKYASIGWNVTDYSGNRLERGVYLYRSKVGNKETKTKKLIIR